MEETIKESQKCRAVRPRTMLGGATCGATLLDHRIPTGQKNLYTLTGFLYCPACSLVYVRSEE